MEEELDIEKIEDRKFNISCCRSYMTPRGRCYSCPEDNEFGKEMDGHEEENEETSQN